MSRDDVFNKVKDIVVDTLEVDPDQVTEQTKFSDLNADSLDMLQVVMGIEDEFGLTIDSDAAQAITTVGAAVDAIMAQL
ncbi:MAG: acyl carrier protein [Coriobacteriales bacterium]|nr:acyl carrier protein [Coriobacteriales bacterium]